MIRVRDSTHSPHEYAGRAFGHGKNFMVRWGESPVKHRYRAVLVLALSVIFAFNNAAFINAVQPTLDVSGGTADPPGFNGFVKIHEGNTGSEQLVDNEPQVCTFHVHGFKFGPIARILEHSVLAPDRRSKGGDKWHLDRKTPMATGAAS